ncbi:hypothetical protein D3C75_771150 [compost metagenome]
MLLEIAYEESTDIQCPVRGTCNAKIKAVCNLLPQRLPIGRYISRPCYRAVTVLPGKSGTRQIHNPFACVCRTLAFIDAFGMQQRIGIDDPRIEITFGLCRVNQHALLGFRLHRSLPVGFERLGAVAPPGVNSMGEQSGIGLLPVQLTRFLPEGIIGGLIAEQEAALAHFLVIITAGGHNRPYRYH